MIKGILNKQDGDDLMDLAQACFLMKDIPELKEECNTLGLYIMKTLKMNMDKIKEDFEESQLYEDPREQL